MNRFEKALLALAIAGLCAALWLAECHAQVSNCTSNVTFSVPGSILTNPPPPVITTNPPSQSATQVVYQCGSPPPPPSTNQFAIAPFAGAGYCVRTDAAGNIYTSGQTTGAGYVTKYAGISNVWTVTLPTTGPTPATVQSIAIDKDGNVIALGQFSGTITIGSTVLFSMGGNDIFLAKLDGNTGSVIWAKKFGYTADDNGSSVATDPNNGDIVIAGSFTRAVNLVGTQQPSNATGTDSYIARYTTDGVFLWWNHFNCISTDFAVSAAVDSFGNTYLAGGNQGVIGLMSTVVAGTNVWVNLPPLGSGAYMTYVGKFSSTGTCLWEKGFGNGLNCYANGIALDGGGNPYVIGSFYTHLTIGSQIINGSQWATSTYLTKLSPVDGTPQWARAVSGSSYVYPQAVAADANGNVMITGYFTGPADFGGGTIALPGTKSGYLAEYTSAGAYKSAIAFGSGFTFSYNVAFVGNGNRLVTGQTDGGNFNGTTINTGGSFNAFLMRLAP